MGGAVSIGKGQKITRSASTSVIPGIHNEKNKLPAHSPSKRKLTMRHTVRLDTEATQRVQSMVLDMSRTGRVELTSTTDHDEAGVPLGTLTQKNLLCLQHVPVMILSMTHLTEVNLRSNEISDLPKEIGKLVALQVLVLSKNKLSKLPDDIGKLTKLRVLEISENQLGALPQSLGHLEELEVLLVSRNKLANLPDSIGGCQKLQILNLYSNVLVEMNHSVSQLSELVELNASNNNITKLPAELRHWKNLRRLLLQVNQLRSLPALDDLCNLEVLQVQQNQLEALPSMKSLVHLTTLDANCNNITALPCDSIAHMTGLVHLNLRHNQLTEISPQITRCLELEILDLGANPIASPIPTAFAELTKLRTLLLDGCKIFQLPIELISLRSVCRVHLGSCLNMEEPETCEVLLALRDNCARQGGWLKTGDWDDRRTESMPSDFWNLYSALENKLPDEPARRSRFQGGEGSTDILAGHSQIPPCK